MPSDEARYDMPGWKLAEKQASDDYKAGRVKSAENIDGMFGKIKGGKVNKDYDRNNFPNTPEEMAW